VTTKNIKLLVLILSTLFISTLLSSVFMNKYDEKLLDIQVAVGDTFALNKTNTLNLNNSYRSLYVNYDKLLNSNKILIKNIDDLVKQYPEQVNLKQLQTIIIKQSDNIDLIKRTNSLITNSLYFIKYKPSKIFSNQNSNQKKEAILLRNLSRKLVGLSYDIKQTDISVLKRYDQVIEKFKHVNLTDKRLLSYQDIFLSHTQVILRNTLLLRKNIEEFNTLDESLNIIYNNIKTNIFNEHIKIKDRIKYAQTILILSLFIFIYLILRFLKLEKKSKEEQERLQDLISKNIIISTTDLKGNITSASDKFCEVSGYTKEELIGTSHNIIRHSNMQNKIFKQMWKTIKKGKVWRGNIKNRKKDGGFYWVDAIIEPIFNKKKEIVSYLAIRVDITTAIALKELSQNQEILINSQIEVANMQRDKALEASRAKSEFLANMSHEIRTPLNAIMGFIELLKDNEKSKTKLNYLSIINNSSNNLLKVINDILDFSKIESGNLIIDNTNFNPIDEFNLTKKLFEAKAKEKNIKLHVNYSQLPKSLYADILRIKQVINNLLSNAVKFTHENKNIYLNIKYIDNKFLQVNVKDEGIGISIQYQEKIFDAFSQEDSSTTRKYGGTGLGLTISSNLISAMGGELKLNSTLGVGSDFYFSIPVSIGESIKETITKTTTQHLEGHVLLVEDNKANQMFMKIILKKLGLTFDIANDGLEAVEIYKNNNYDIVLMDENMPNMCGIDATRIINEYENKNNLIHTPIIALTANALKGDRERFLKAGMDEYITKPIDKDKLNKILCNLLL